MIHQTDSLQKTLRAIASTLPGMDASDTIDVSVQAKRLGLTNVHVQADAYQLIVGKSHLQASGDQDTQVLALLVDAKEAMKPDGMGYFEHWAVGQHSRGNTPMLYRFAVFESSKLDGAWLITESCI